ncbi:DUF4358 domain-containing protein [Paenibacillus sp. SYP-B3998]|uniref:DUF4358 domain-containing protein n=1 Tax=Paenibacillus sp. SYP-B3998 TaxID=2678564 RepID=A0A6G4A5Q3_9BACL|nr:DUF4358 domain-containing protein [Paenibacillus sp. SYP-B3998]NEW09702.1 DUF4358 domain-containing protein [Paenibacillus sp. SYP-B3998]
MIKQFENINQKWFMGIFVYIIVFGASVGCSSKEEGESHLSALEVGKHIKQTVKLDNLKEDDTHKLEKLYQIKPQEVESFILYTAVTNIKADELTVIKVKDANQLESIQEKILKRIEAQEVKFKDYRPDQYFLVEKHVLKKKGNYIFFVVSEEAEQMESAFDEAFK